MKKNIQKEIRSKMIKDMEIKDLINIPLSRTTTIGIEKSIPVKVYYKIYKHGDLIIGVLIIDNIEKRVVVLTNDIICEITNLIFKEDELFYNKSHSTNTRCETNFWLYIFSYRKYFISKVNFHYYFYNSYYHRKKTAMIFLNFCRYISWLSDRII